jgi:hypothetical protein
MAVQVGLRKVTIAGLFLPKPRNRNGKKKLGKE